MHELYITYNVRITAFLKPAPSVCRVVSFITWSASLQAEVGHGDVLSAVSGLKVRRVCLVFGLRYERHLMVLEVVPVQTLEQGVTP